MAKIRLLERQSFGGGSSAAISVAGAGARQVGQTLSEVGQQISDFGAEQSRINDNNYFNEKTVEWQMQAKDTFNGWKKDNESNPVGQGEGLDEKLNLLGDDLFKDAPSKRAKELVGNFVSQERVRYQGYGSNWSESQNTANVVIKTESAAKGLNLVAFNNEDPLQINAYLSQVENTVAANSEILPVDVLVKQADTMKTGVITASVRGALDRDDMEGASELLANEDYQEILGVDGIQKLQNEIDKKVAFEEKRAVRLNNMKTSKPWDYIAEVGGNDNLQPFDFSKPSESFRKREQGVSDANEQHNIDLPFLSDSEVDAFSKTFQDNTPEIQVGLLQTIDMSADPDLYDDIAAQLFPKNPSAAAAMSISIDSPRTAQAILKGQQLINTKSAPVPKETAFNQVYFDKISNSIEDPQLRSFARDAVKALYVQMAFESGTVGEGGVVASTVSDVDTTLFDDAYMQVMGDTVNINDKQSLTFRTTTGEVLSGDDFEDLFDDMTESDIVKSSVSMPMFGGDHSDLDTIKEYTQPITVGDGQYYLRMKTSNEYLTDIDGEPYILDMKELHKIHEVPIRVEPKVGQREPFI